MSKLFLLCIFFACGHANPHSSGNNGGYPPMWDLIPDSLGNSSTENVGVIINPWNYTQRLQMYKVMLNVTAPFLDMKEPDNKKNVLWGLPLQHGWQFHTGRLIVGGEPETEDQTYISVRSWWACMNYYLAVVPFLGALDAGFLHTYDIHISRPKESESDFCYNIAHCHSSVPKAMESWKKFFEIIKTSSQTDISMPPLDKNEEKFLSYMWKAHVESINAALPRCSKRLNYLSVPEGNFGKDWSTAVEFLAAANFHTNFQSTVEFQHFLPHRKLVNGDKAPYIADFTEQENRVLNTLQQINKANALSGGFLLKIWKQAMCSDQARAEGRNLLNNMINDPKMTATTVLKIIRALVTNLPCKV